MQTPNDDSGFGDKFLEAMAISKARAGEREPIYDEKGEHIGTTVYGGPIPETFYKTITITPNMVSPDGHITLDSLAMHPGEFFRLMYPTANQFGQKAIPDSIMLFVRQICDYRDLHYKLERAKIYKSEEWKNSAFNVTRQTDKSLMVASLMEDVQDCLQTAAAQKSVIQTVVDSYYPYGFYWKMPHMEYEFIRRWVNHIGRDLSGSDLQQSSSSSSSSAVLSAKHLGVRDPDHPVQTRSELRKERERRRLETKNQGWRAGNTPIRGRNGY